MKEWREKEYDFVIFYLIWKDWVFCLHTHKWDQNQCSSLSKFIFGELGYLRRGKRPQGMRENKMRLVKY